MEQNILVYSSRCGPDASRLSMEFELTRHNHMKDENVPFTVTACFKTPPAELRAEAWRILLHVTAGKQLCPEHVLQYANDALARQGKSLPELMEPTSASSVPAMVEPPSASSDPVVESEAPTTPTSPDFGGDSDLDAEEESVFQTVTQHASVDQAVVNTGRVAFGTRQSYTASAIYSFYRTLRLVVLKISKAS